ncbi:MAG: leucine-rich repeat domain-containing protein [Clostridium sp.]|nr:leucine-rich repeat domain-containing protein [Clostridium sp.]
MNKKFLKLIIVTILSSSMLSLSIPAYAEEINENTTKEISETENLTYFDDEEIVDIPDENLKKAINIQLGKNEDSNLTKGELKLITSLDISNSNIKSLKGLEYCGNLVSLNISHNNVIDISPLENLSNLVDLNLSYNQITDITPLKEFKNLVSIDTTANAVGNLNILDGLLDFNVDADYDKTIDVNILENLDSLINIDVSENNNVDFDFSSTLDEIIPDIPNIPGNTENAGSTGNTENNSSLGSGLLDAFGKIDISSLFGGFGSSGLGSSSLGSLSSLGTGSSSLGGNSSLLSSSSFLTDSSNTIKSASPTQTGDTHGLSGIITLISLAGASILSLILNRKKQILKD